MCNHFKPGDDPEDIQWMIEQTLARVLGTSTSLAGTDAWPKRKAPVVFMGDSGPVIDSMRWGVCVPIQGKPNYVTNARSDKLLSSFTWKHSARERRCLVPARGYFEPGTGPKGARGELYFTIKDRPRFFIAGLWDRDRDESDTQSFAMVTTEPNGYAARFHDRMPVVLSDLDAKAWLGDKPLSDDHLLALCRPPPDGWMQHEEIAAKAKIPKEDLFSD